MGGQHDKMNVTCFKLQTSSTALKTLNHSQLAPLCVARVLFNFSFFVDIVMVVAVMLLLLHYHVIAIIVIIDSMALLLILWVQ